MKKYFSVTYYKKWKRKDTLLLLERMELYISSGLPIDKVLIIIREGMKTHHKRALAGMHDQIMSGLQLSGALVTYIGISKNISGLIEQGELSGQLAQSITAAHALLEREDELYKKCISALAYPVVIGLFALVLTIGLIRGVMPQIIPMLKSLNIQLPLLTRIVMFVSENIIAYGIYMCVFLLLLICIHLILIKKNSSYRKIVHHILIRIPLAGKLIYSYSLSLFLQSCGILIESGVPVTRAFIHTTSSVSLIPLLNLLKNEVSNIDRGVAFGSVLLKKPDIPEYIPSLILAGEASGTLGISLRRAATILDRDIEHSLKRLTSLIEPIMMAGMGGIVGAIALSIMMPIYDISKVLQH